ncbi:MAG: aminotransferase class III-fold pyridoxal phosphate-dependent enzyme, partial [Chloroflexi bacterium]|nr:aminotransferase class III-fold pyridoxal phosphate-dependent enzyme [Chloroflexota bacterium]
PVSCAVGLAVLDVIEDENLQANAEMVGGYLLEGLRRLASRHAIIGDVRGAGLFAGVEFVLDRETREPAPKQASYIIERMRAHGILLSIDGPLHNVLKIKPPIVFTQANTDTLIDVLDKVLLEDSVQI